MCSTGCGGTGTGSMVCGVFESPVSRRWTCMSMKAGVKMRPGSVERSARWCRESADGGDSSSSTAMRARSPGGGRVAGFDQVRFYSRVRQD